MSLAHDSLSRRGFLAGTAAALAAHGLAHGEAPAAPTAETLAARLHTALTPAQRQAICFPWNVLARQVRVAGRVEKVSAAESDAYFATRPRGSQIGAWASRQSEIIADRSVLDDWYAEIEQRFAGIEVTRPPHWGGFRVLPDELEFWQGRPSRLHDRFRYRRDANMACGWRAERLSP
jgi:pyridoxamine 5'-phosphate oxidase